MRTGKSGDSGRRYSDICGATNNRGQPCKLPAGWGTPGSGGERCKFHGGASTGPSDTSHLEDNDFATDNPGGGAPELNTNAVTAHGMWSDWRKVYERLPLDRKAHVEQLTEETVVKTNPYTSDLDPEERERLARKYWVLSEIKGAVDYDMFAGIGENPAEDARGVMVKEDVELDGEVYQVDKPNPALARSGQVRARRRRLEDQLNFFQHYHDDSPPWENTKDDEKTLAEVLSSDQ